MTPAYVALGSNVEPCEHLSRAARELARCFPGARFSPCYRNAAYGFDGDDFLNAVAELQTGLAVEPLLASLRAIERRCGRRADDPKWGPRAMDLDLLLYGALVGSGPGYVLPRPDLTRRAYMLGPLAELAPDLSYPPHGPTMAVLWKGFDDSKAPLHRTQLDLNALIRR